MFRLILLLLFVTAAAAAENAEMASLLGRLKPLRNAFAEPIVNDQHIGAESINGVLYNVVAGYYGTAGSGCVVLDGTAWRTGETRRIVTPSRPFNVVLVAVRPADETRAASAEFKIIETEQSVTVDLKGVEPAVDVAVDPAGWLISPRVIVTAEKVPAGRVRVKTSGAEFGGRQVLRSSGAGLSIVELSEPAGAEVATAVVPSEGAVIIAPLHREKLRVPVAVLEQPPTKEFLVGALVTTEDGRVVGVLSKSGLVTVDQMGITSRGGAALAGGFSRRVTLQAEAEN